MVMNRLTFVICIMLLISPKSVQADERKIADYLSYTTVITQITLDSIRSYRSSDRKHAYIQQSLRTGLVIGSSELVKRLVHKERPDKSDDKSFWSEHSALSCSAEGSGKDLYVGIPLDALTMFGRWKAKKHDVIDVSVGCGIGILAHQLFH